MAFEQRLMHAENARKLIAILNGVNDQISDANLAKASGVPINGSGQYAIQVALRQLEKQDPPVSFQRLRGFGWKRLSDAEIVARSEGDLRKIARGARRGRKKLNRVVEFDRLSSGEQMQAARNSARLAQAEESASTVKPRKIASSIPDLNDLLAKLKEA